MLGNILVTGGCGFIGANLVRVLTERNLVRSLRVIDANPTAAGRRSLPTTSSS